MEHFDWADELGAAVTVTDARGVIVFMNRRAQEVFASSGGGALVGKSVFDCHPEKTQNKLRALYDEPRPNHYTICKAGQKKVIHQIPRYRDGAFAGVVEISVPIPDTMPHFDRG